MENNATNRAYIARMTLDGMTYQEMQKALQQELCERYRTETGLFNTVVQTLKDKGHRLCAYSSCHHSAAIGDTKRLMSQWVRFIGTVRFLSYSKPIPRLPNTQPIGGTRSIERMAVYTLGSCKGVSDGRRTIKDSGQHRND